MWKPPNGAEIGKGANRNNFSLKFLLSAFFFEFLPGDFYCPLWLPDRAFVPSQFAGLI